jgi:hypothetical protein
VHRERAAPREPQLVAGALEQARNAYPFRQCRGKAGTLAQRAGAPGQLAAATARSSSIQDASVATMPARRGTTACG